MPIIGKYTTWNYNGWNRKYLGNSKILMEYRSHTIADIEKCNTCKNVNVCKGGCRARAYFINGSILACDPVSCKMY